MAGDIKITVRHVEPTNADKKKRRYHLRKFLELVMAEHEELQNNAVKEAK